FKLIDRVYADYLRRNDNLFLLFIDSDCILDKVCIQNIMYEMELKPGSKRNMLAMTGVITSTTIKNSIITVLQDMEYIHGQLFERTVESGCGAVTCLPGALTMLRFSAFRRMAKWYFADKAEQISDLFDWGKCHLGEDRWLTHLFMIGARERYQIQMNTGAFCKTEAVQTFKSLLKQRRRWFLGFITNEVCMLTDVRLWKRYPVLLVIRLAQNTIRTTALLFFIMVISIVTTSQKISNLPVGFIAISLGLNWLLMLYFGAKLGRWKIMLYPLMFVLNPFFNYIYMVYGIFTAGNRTWGGPRADAAIKADEHTTPAEAIQKAEEEGNELLLVPETLKPAFEAARHRYPHQAPLLPPGRLEGRFAPSEALPGGWYRRYRDSGILRADMTLRTVGDAIFDSKCARSHSVDSVDSDLSSTESVYYRPRRVESLVGVTPAGRVNEHQAQRTSVSGQMMESDKSERLSADFTRPQVSRSRSEDSVSLHFGVPIRQPTVPKIALKRQRSAPPEICKPARVIPTKSSSTRATPRSAYRPSERYPHSPVRGIGISPLARKSFTRLASPPPDETVPMSAAEVIELERAAAARASLEAERRGRQRERVEHYASGRRKPRKLSKHKPSEGKGTSRSSSKDQ
ncbi:glycosyltransferase family 2 protein, partial [Hortaea werneckii]